MANFVDYYEHFLNNNIEKGNRNNMFFRAILAGLASNRSIEPLIDKALNIGLSTSEVNATVNSAKRIDINGVNVYSRYYEPITGSYINEFGKPISKDELRNQFRKQITTMFRENDLILIASLSKDDKDIIRRSYAVYEFQTLLSDDFEIPSSAVVKINPVSNKTSTGRIEDISAFRYVLIECDDVELEKQYSIFCDAIAPIEFMVHSGNRSIHCYCRVDAKNLEEYRYRAGKLAEYFIGLGLNVDRAVLHPAAYGRVAGSLRGEVPQCLYDKPNRLDYETFEKQFLNSRLSQIYSFKQVKELVNFSKNETLIENLLKEKSTMVIAGEAKIGKTMLLLHLAVAFSTGGIWLNRQVRKRKCLFVNLEVEPTVIVDRIEDIARYAPIDEDNLFMLNLRGCELHFEDLIKAIANNADGMDVVIVDPIYKLFAGDENSSKEVIRLVALIDEYFLRKNKTFIFSHHYNKNNTSAINRVSGSSIFTRYPEAILGISKGKEKGEIKIEYSLRAFESPYPEIYRFNYPCYDFVRSLGDGEDIKK